MKKTILFILSAALLLLAACSAADVSAENTQDADTAPEETREASAAPESTQSASAKPSASADAKKYLITKSIDSKCIAGNLIDVRVARSVYIYLPPSYYEGDKAYPVVYYLHGHGEPAGTYVRYSQTEMDDAFKAGASEFIFVGIDGGACYYVNSPVTGNWEDYILEEVIPLIDESYRTIPEAASRGICGFSMGGFGSINLALRHPDVFGAVYSMSPGLLRKEDFAEAMDSWKSGGMFLTDYSRAFAPNPDSKTLGDIPKMDGSKKDNKIIEKWLSGFGHLEEKIAAYKELGIPLKAIGFSYGTGDSYGWIPKGTQYFSDLLKQNGIDNTLFVFDGGHVPPEESMAEHLIPFFNKNLAY